MRVLFVIEPPKRKNVYLTQLQPLGVLYMAAFLESKKIETDVLDFNVQNKEDIDPSKYDLIGYSVTCGNIQNTLQSIKSVKSLKPKTKIIVGGPMVQLAPKKLISMREVDALIDGEADDIIYHYLTIEDKLKLPGLWIKYKGNPYFTGKSKPVTDLNTLPFPAIDKVPYWKYRVVLKKRSPVAGIMTSRGCPYRCIFCHHSLGFKFRARNPKNVVDEIKRNIKLGIKELWIADDNFTYDMKRVEKICDLIIKQSLDITFTLANGVRVDKLNYTLLKKLKKAGCWLLTIAPESGNAESLEKIKKGFTLNDALKAAKLCKNLNIKTMSNYVFGFPWEREDDIIQTINFAKQLDTDITHFSRIVPYPGTPFWNMINATSYELVDEGPNYGGLRYEHPHIDDKKFRQLIKKAYRETMLRPQKIFNLARMLKPKDFIQLGRYALTTKSV